MNWIRYKTEEGVKLEPIEEVTIEVNFLSIGAHIYVLLL